MHRARDESHEKSLGKASKLKLRGVPTSKRPIKSAALDAKPQDSVITSMIQGSASVDLSDVLPQPKPLPYSVSFEPATMPGTRFYFHK